MSFHRPTALAVAALIALAACSGTASTPAPAAPTAAPASAAGGGAKAVSIKNFAFDPATLAAKLGDTVTWTNNDSTPHTVTFEDTTVTSSGEFAGGATFAQTFNRAGSFAYKCLIHPQMVGTVTAS